MKDNDAGWQSAAQTRQRHTYDRQRDGLVMGRAARRQAKHGKDAIAHAYNVESAVAGGRVALLTGASAADVADRLADWGKRHPAQVRLLLKRGY